MIFGLASQTVSPAKWVTSGMRIRMLERHRHDQHTGPTEMLDDLRVGVPDGQPGEVGDLGDEAAVVVHGVVDLEANLAPQLVVLLAMAGSDVNEARAGVHGHEVRGHDDGVALDPRMTADRSFEVGAGQRQRHRLRPAADALKAHERLGERAGHDQRLTVQLHRRVGLSGVHGDRQVGRERPGGRRPDDKRSPPATQGLRQGGSRGLHGELHVHRGRRLVFVLHLGLGQRRLAVHAPVNGLEPLVHEAAPHKASEFPGDRRLVGGLHRDVRVLPVPEHAQPLELLALDVDELGGVVAAATEFLHGVHGGAHVHLGRVEPELLVHLVLDREPMAVPAGHVHRVVAEHGARLHDEILQDLVERRAHVDVAVGVGRAVVEDPEGPVLPRLPEPGVDVHRLPAAEHLRLHPREGGLHGEVRLRQVQRRLVVHRVNP